MTNLLHQVSSRSKKFVQLVLATRFLGAITLVDARSALALDSRNVAGETEAATLTRARFNDWVWVSPPPLRPISPEIIF